MIKTGRIFWGLKGNFGWDNENEGNYWGATGNCYSRKDVFQTIFCWSVSFISSLFTLQSSDTIPDSEIKLLCKYRFPFLWTSICQCFHYLSCSGNFDVSISLRTADVSPRSSPLRDVSRGGTKRPSAAMSEEKRLPFAGYVSISLPVTVSIQVDSVEV